MIVLKSVAACIVALPLLVIALIFLVGPAMDAAVQKRMNVDRCERQDFRCGTYE